MVQVASTVDIASILDSYAGSGDLAPIPPRWFDEAIDIFDVEIERQQLLEDGQWSQVELVATLPGKMTYRDKLNEGSIDAIERNSIIRELRTGVQETVITPDFYVLKGLEPEAMDHPETWEGNVDIEETPLQLLEEELREAEDAIAKQEDKIDKIDEEIRGAGGRGGMGGGGGSSGQEQKIKQLRRKLEIAKEKLETLIEEKKEIEVQIEELKAESNIEVGETVLEGEVWIWGHDLGVEPGKTYRYRTRILVANPFFGHKPSLYPSQHMLAETVELTSDQSGWSEPVQVQESEQWLSKKRKR